MPLPVFRKLIDQFPPGGRVHLQGLGEPLMHPGFFEMVWYSRQRGMEVSTNTNLTLLDREKAEECVRSGLSWVRISIDGATPVTYESIRRGSRLDRVIENIELLNGAKLKMASSLPRLYLVMVLMRKNFAELPSVVRLAHSLDVEQVFVQHIEREAGDGPQRAFAEEQALREEDAQQLHDCFNEARALALRFALELRLPTRISGAVLAKTRRRCDWPWRSAYITHDGTALPCCMLGLPENINFGNMAREGVEAVWNNEDYRDFRRRLDSDDPPALCRGCAVYRGVF
jgi:radical SAM protein with 4Fe4S-binding SPASM domain